jgi:ABC-type enterochelin transport system ATPase subunit
MATKLSEQIQATMDALALAQTQAALVALTMRKQSVYFGLDYSHFDDDIGHVTSRLRYAKQLAERRERAEAERDKTAD